MNANANLQTFCTQVININRNEKVSVTAKVGDSTNKYIIYVQYIIVNYKACTIVQAVFRFGIYHNISNFVLNSTVFVA